MCLAAGIVFVVALVLLSDSSPHAADVGSSLLRPGEALANILGFTAHDLVGFLFVIPGNMFLYGAALFLVVHGAVTVIRRRGGGNRLDKTP
jgi:hypothetical protein